jgi:hypothetical protein
MFGTGSLQKMRQKYWKNSAKTWMCTCCQIESKTQFMYSFHGSMVEHPHTIRGRVFNPRQIQVWVFYFDFSICTTFTYINRCAHFVFILVSYNRFTSYPSLLQLNIRCFSVTWSSVDDGSMYIFELFAFIIAAGCGCILTMHRGMQNNPRQIR